MRSCVVVSLFGSSPFLIRNVQWFVAWEYEQPTVSLCVLASLLWFLTLLTWLLSNQLCWLVKCFVFVGDNVIVGSYDQRLCWFDLDLSVKPYKTLRFCNGY